MQGITSTRQPSSGRGCGLRVASQGELSSPAFRFISHPLNANEAVLSLDLSAVTLLFQDFLLTK